MAVILGRVERAAARTPRPTIAGPSHRFVPLYRKRTSQRRLLNACAGPAALLAVTAAGGAALAHPLPLDPARESAVAARLEQIRQSPPQLRMFLHAMPKGGDLHNHLGGGTYAEDFIRWGAARGYCVDPAAGAIVTPPCAPGAALNELGATDEFAHDRLVDALSVRGWTHGVGRNAVSGHNQFFGTFARFGPVGAVSAAQMLASARRIAAGDNLSYLELDHNPASLMEAVSAAGNAPLSEAELPSRLAAELRQLAPLIAGGLRELDSNEAASARELGCGAATAEPACAVAVHYLFQGMRALPPGQVFRSLVLGFMLADADPRYVGINLVMPEDAVLARRDYRLHMAMVRLLAQRFPAVKITLHAGELTLGQVPPEDLRDHIALAIDAGARRIGHGTDIAYEDAAEATLRRMARSGIAVEINLTSNAVILGVQGADHPLSLYRQFGVPVVLSTDDQGVLRSDMTNEYVRAVREQGLGYAELKRIARAGIRYSFVPGQSLWADPAGLAPVAACRDLAAPDCVRFLAGNEKARLEADLEQRFAAFEAGRLSVGAAE